MAVFYFIRHGQMDFSAEQMKARVFAVLDQYRDYCCVIVSCHGTLMQYVLDIPHPENGQIVKLEYG